jgi:hypothetical protein
VRAHHHQVGSRLLGRLAQRDVGESLGQRLRHGRTLTGQPLAQRCELFAVRGERAGETGSVALEHLAPARRRVLGHGRYLDRITAVQEHDLAACVARDLDRLASGELRLGGEIDAHDDLLDRHTLDASNPRATRTPVVARRDCAGGSRNA